MCYSNFSMHQNINRNGWHTVEMNSRQDYHGGSMQKPYNPLQAPSANNCVPHTPQLMAETQMLNTGMPPEQMTMAENTSQPAPLRTMAKTQELFDSICAVFPENKTTVQSVLNSNLYTTNIEVLSHFVMQAL